VATAVEECIVLPVVYERTTRCIAGSRLGAVGFIRSVETGRVLDRVCFTFVFTRLDLSRDERRI
jgi:hypothetical protein